MTSSTTSKILGLTLGAALSITWLGSVMLGMHSASVSATRTIELPAVVIVGHKTAAVNATALPPAAHTRKA